MPDALTSHAGVFGPPRGSKVKRASSVREAPEVPEQLFGAAATQREPNVSKDTSGML